MLHPKRVSPARKTALLLISGAALALSACANDRFGAASDAEAITDSGAETSDASYDALSDTSPDASTTTTCVLGRGAAMIAIDDAGTCIDGTEVTIGEYETFLQSSEPRMQPPTCAWNVSFVPDVAGMCAGIYDLAKPDNPVACVDWCDAYAYCAWAGKRLCGAVGGGPAPFTSVSSQPSAWTKACTRNGARLNPYGNAFQSGACNSAGAGHTASAPVGTFSACVGGYPGIFDMSGNVLEWEDACETDGGSADPCRLRGGSYAYSSGSGVSVDDCANLDSEARNATIFDIGIRCCSR